MVKYVEGLPIRIRILLRATDIEQALSEMVSLEQVVSCSLEKNDSL